MASIWDSITGRKSAPTPTHTSTPSHHAPADSGDTAPTSTFTSSPTPTFDPTTSGDVSSFLTPGTLDPTLLHPLAGLSSTLSYLDLDETALSPLGGSTALPSRGWSDDLCYGTGTVYLVGLSAGGLWGLSEGLRKAPPAAPRLKLNYVLNGMTRRGPFLGNSGGVLALVYNGVNSAIGSVRGKHDAANSVLAGVVAGAVFKSTKGVRPMAWSAVMVGGAAGAWTVVSRALL